MDSRVLLLIIEVKINFSLGFDNTDYHTNKLSNVHALHCPTLEVKSCHLQKNQPREKEGGKDERQLKDKPAPEHGEELGRRIRWQQWQERQPGEKG